MVRRKGIMKLLGGMVVIALFWPFGMMALLDRLMAHPHGSLPRTAGVLLAGLMSAPFVLLCTGLIEVATGRPFRQTSSKWNRLGEWKQGVFSFLLIWLGIGFMALLLYLSVRYLAG